MYNFDSDFNFIKTFSKESLHISLDQVDYVIFGMSYLTKLYEL
jgi:hypothetical protein